MSHFSCSAPLIPELVGWQGRWKRNEAAIICQTEKLTWHELDDRTNQLANFFISHGVSVGSRVVVLMENSADAVIAYYAILKAGACVVPLNVTLSSTALAKQIKDSESKTIVVSLAYQETVEQLLKNNAIDGLDLCIGNFDKKSDRNKNSIWVSFQSILANFSCDFPSVSVSNDDECNVIYSSGTTGSPKGIVHTHRARLDWAYDLSIALRYQDNTATICSLGLYSNISWVSLLANLIVGGCVVIQKKFDAVEFIKLVNHYQITHCAGVPIQYQRILDVMESQGTTMTSLKMLMCCGSSLSPELKSKIIQNTSAELIELYGLTEGVITTQSAHKNIDKIGTVGKPLVGTEVQVIDDSNQLLLSNKVGEIISSGRIMMKGYLNKPEQDKLASWQDKEGELWLRTGDIGRIDEDGFLYVVDRKKDMIISGGQNIYPQDLEKVILQHPRVQEVAVIGVTCDIWGETPMAFIVISERVVGGQEAGNAEILTWSNKRLGKQQKIRHIKTIKKLPRNPNGKVLKKQLRDIAESAEQS